MHIINVVRAQLVKKDVAMAWLKVKVELSVIKAIRMSISTLFRTLISAEVLLGTFIWCTWISNFGYGNVREQVDLACAFLCNFLNAMIGNPGI